MQPQEFSIYKPTARIKEVRKDVLEMSQEEFVADINKYLAKLPEYREDRSLYDQVKFSQFTLSEFENSGTLKKIKTFRIFLAIDYLYCKHHINPSWITLRDNSNIPLRTDKKIAGPKDMFQLHDNIIETTNDLRNNMETLLKEYAKKQGIQVNALNIMLLNQ